MLLLSLSAHTEERVDMAQEDEGGWEDWLLMVGHNEMVALVLPHQIRNGLHLQIHITVKQCRRESEVNANRQINYLIYHHVHIAIKYLCHRCSACC